MANKELERDFNEQYYILKEEERKEERKKIFILTALCCLTLIFSALTAGLSYYNTKNNEVKNSPTTDVVYNHKSIAVIYDDGEDINITGVNAEWPGLTKKFVVKNSGTVDFNYDIFWDSIVNTFDDENIILTIKRNGNDVVTNKSLPTIKQEILSNIAIEAGLEHKYELIFKYENQPENPLNVNNASSFAGAVKVNINSSSK